MSNFKLPLAFYQREDVVQIAKELLGKKLCTQIHGNYTSGYIVETEAYKAPEDAASHAYKNKKTNRTSVFYEDGGVAYVYLIYGVYSLFNIITHFKDVPHAILIRAIEPIDGIGTMLERRNLPQLKKNITAGPGLTAMALGINQSHNGVSLVGNTIWIEDAPLIQENRIIQSPRVGLGKRVKQPYFSMPWRFRVKDNAYTSKAK